jgi:hypothetical protein
MCSVVWLEAWPEHRVRRALTMKVEVEHKPIPVLVEVKTWDGSHYEWREVPGVEMRFEGVTLKNGDTLTIESTAHNTRA